MSSGLRNKVRIKQVDDHPEPEMVSLVRGCREQDQIPAVILEQLGQPIILGFLDLPAALVGGEMVRLVKHAQIPPGSVLEPLHARLHLERVDAGDQAVVLGKGIGLAVGHVSLGTENLEVEVEDLVEFPVPVVHQPGRDHHQRTKHFPPAGEFPEDEGGLDRLAQADLIADQESAGRRRGDPVRQDNLMGQQVDSSGREGGGTLQERQGMRLVREPCPTVATFARRHGSDDLLRPPQCDRQG